jgi:hypothetical protein
MFNQTKRYRVIFYVVCWKKCLMDLQSARIRFYLTTVKFLSLAHAQAHCFAEQNYFVITSTISLENMDYISYFEIIIINHLQRH